MESAENLEQPISGNESKDNSGSSLSKIETIALLNDSIDRLEQTIKGISKNSAPIPSSDSINTLLTTTQELADAVASGTEKISSPNSSPENKETSATTAKIQAEPIVANPIVANPVVSPKVSDSSTVKQKTPPTVTKVKPKQNLPLTIIGVIAIAITLVAIFWFWLIRPPASLNSLDLSNPDLATNSEKLESPTDQETLSTPSIEEPVVVDNLPSQDLATDMESSNSNPEEPTEIIVPANLEAPGRTKNLKLVPIEPELDFTPEQTLIAAIKTKITKLTQDYPTKLIDSAKVDLSQNCLLVNVTDEWYELSESSQNKVANEMLNRSRSLSFDQLELKDRTGTLVARNPVIGEQIIILESQKQS